MMSSKNLGVAWSAVSPKTGKLYKKPFAYTTQSDSELARLCAEQGYTWNEMATMSYLSTELKEVIDRFIKDGYGDTPMSDHVS